jgi:hypothetical protein
MATDFTLTTAATALYRSTLSGLFTLTLVGGVDALDDDFALDDGGAGGTFSPTTPTITAGDTETTFTYTPSATASGIITISATSSGGLVAGPHELDLPINFPFVGTNATEIIRQAWGTILGVGAPGQPISPRELQDLLLVLNSIVDAWRIEKLFATSVETVSGLLPANARTITVGPSGDIVTQLSPVAVENAFFTSGTLDMPVRPMTARQFDDIGYKTLSTLGPDHYDFSPGTPNAQLVLYPQAASDVMLTLRVRTETSKFADLTTRYNLGPGVQRALAYTLARDIAPGYRTQLSPSAELECRNARRSLQSANHVTPKLDTARAAGNILTGWEQ